MARKCVKLCVSNAKETANVRTIAFAHPPIASLPRLPPPTSAYIHLPFCAQRCAYCAFPVVVSGRASLPDAATSTPAPPLQSHADYIDLISREITAVAARWRQRAQPPLRTLYLGGGTPSLLHPHLLSSLLRTVRAALPLQPDAEITCEMDPATFTPATAAAYRALGINRASVGAQSFDDTLLSACRRIHTSSDIRSALSSLRSAGIDNVSLDLISGLPGQTLTSWQKSLAEAISLAPEHISAYDLTLEPDTPFGAAYTAGQSPLPAESLAARMMTVAAETLSSAGYEHYEVSNYARRTLHGEHKAPYRSQHNMAYWRNEPFYAFGLGATSVVDGFRFARPRRMGDYKRYVDALDAELTGLANVDDDEKRSGSVTRALYPNVTPLSERECLEDFLINSFRLLVDGVDFDKLRSKFGEVPVQRLLKATERNSALIEQGYLVLMRSVKDGTPKGVRLSEQGALIENSVLSTLLQDGLWRYPVSK